MEGFVYLLCDGEKFKIGMTKHKDIYKRIKELQTGNPNEIWLAAYHKTNYPYKIEKLMHMRHHRDKILNEWYDLDAHSVAHFNDECKICEGIVDVLKDNPFF